MRLLAFEQHIECLIAEAGLMMVRAPRDQALVDYIFRDALGDCVAVEVKSQNFLGTDEQLSQVVTAIKQLNPHIGKFLLVTPFDPGNEKLLSFLKAFAQSNRIVEWLSGDQFARLLGLEPFGLMDNAPRRRRFTGEMPAPIDLNRQLSPELVNRLGASTKSTEAFLRVGERVPVLVVLSDIKNFSLLVKAAKPDDLNDAMSKYYRLARELVWEYGGVLDKFIGDAVLAIFSYPTTDKSAPVNATKFAADLIELGTPILAGLKNLINEAIDTGTRVGISAGEISVLNIGLQTIELSFVGDVINLAARLEHESEVNGCLIDNLTKVALAKSDATFCEDLSLVDRKLERARVKGQLTSIQAWQISAAAVLSISIINDRHSNGMLLANDREISK